MNSQGELMQYIVRREKNGLSVFYGLFINAELAASFIGNFAPDLEDGPPATFETLELIAP